MDAGISTRFDKLHEGTADEILLQFVQSAGLVQNDMLDELTSLRQSEIDKALEALAESGQVLQLASTSSPGRFVVALVDWEDLVNRVRKILAQYHREQPLKAGMAREELKSRLRVDGRSFPSILAQMQEQAVISVRETDVSLHEHEIKLSKDEQERIDQLLSVFANNPFSPPSFKDSVKEIGADLLLYLIQSGQLVKVAADVVFEKRTYQSMKEKIEGALAEHGEITVAQVRDLFGTTRKYSLAMMEHLDEIGLTTRDGDVRRLA
jgi:selenocysteine-specific elongation factor